MADFAPPPCRRLSEEELTARAGLRDMLPAGAAVHECVRRDAQRGGVLLVPNYVAPTEAALLGHAAQELLVRRAEILGRAGRRAPREYNSKTLPLAQLRAGPHIIQQFGRLPGSTRVGRAASVPGEFVQVARTGNRSAGLNMHHDRNRAPTRLLTALLYLGERAEPGGHTIFPLFDAPAARASSSPAVAASSASSSAAASSSSAAAAAAAEEEGALALSSLRRLVRPHLHQLERDNSQALIFADGREGAFGGAVQRLCAAVVRAEQTGAPPPCLAVPPTPGTAAIFYHWRETRTGLAPEWSNFHVGCPSLGLPSRPKLALQSFRLNHSLPVGPSSGSSRGVRTSRGGGDWAGRHRASGRAKW